jgi:hypothetical protein
VEGILIKAIGGSFWALAIAAVAVMVNRCFPPIVVAWTAERASERARLSEKEARVDQSIADRLKNLERQVKEGGRAVARLQTHLGKYHKAVVILAAEVTIIAPDSPKLEEIRELLEIPWSIEQLGPIPPDFNDRLGEM